MLAFLLLRFYLSLATCCINCQVGTSSGCTECAAGYYLIGFLCTPQCPTGYVISDSSCNLNIATTFDITFDSSIRLIDNTHEEWHTSDYSSFEDPTGSAPLITIDRGLWFDSQSSLETNSKVQPGSMSTLFLWVNPYVYGTIVSTSAFLVSYASDGFETTGYFLSQDTGLTVSTMLIIDPVAGWNYLAIQIYQSSGTEATIKYNTIKATSTPSEANFNSSTWIIGGFSGFIYLIKFVSLIGVQLITYAIPTCGSNQYYLDSTCYDCASYCATWPWCVRGDDCSYCATSGCTCTGYLTSMITSCDDSSACLVEFDNVECLSTCPTMFGLDSGICMIQDTGTAVVNFHYPNVQHFSDNFDKYFSFVKNDGMLNAYKRGAYFDGASMNMQSSIDFQFSPVAAFGLWVYPMSTQGNILTKLVGTSTTFTIGMDSGKIYIQVGSDFFYFFTSTLNTWALASVVLSVPSLNTPSYSFYLNANLQGTSTGSVPIIDQISSSVILGYNYLFQGFIFEFLYKAQSNFDFSLNLATYSCGIGPSSLQACLSICGVNYYESSACIQCSAGCSTCINGFSCSTSLAPLCQTNTNYYFCDTCKSQSSEVAGICQCAVQFVHQLQNDMCCQANCQSCSNSPLECSSCDVESDGYCVHDCASLFIYDKAENGCMSSDSDRKIEWNLDVTGTLIVDSSLNPYTNLGNPSNLNRYNPFISATDPVPGKKRGLYFNGNTLVAYNLQLNTAHTWAIWFNPLSSNPGSLIYKKNLSFSIFYRNSYISISYTRSSDLSVFAIICSIPSQLNNWLFLVVRVQDAANTMIYCDISHQSSSTGILTSDSITDAQDTLYVDYIDGSEYYIGWIYDISYYAYFLTNLGGISRNGGPLSISGSLSLCAPHEYDAADGTCQLCSANCITCIDSDSCLVCQDKYCYTCYDFYSEESCEKCTSGMVFQIDTMMCGECPGPCLECWNVRIDTCAKCSQGYVMSLEGICIPECSTGNSALNNTCFSSSGGILAYTFNEIANVVHDTYNNIPMFMGSSDSYYPNYDPFDPFITGKQGIYFTGASYARTASSPTSPVNVYFGNTHSFDMWTRPTAQANNATLISISDGDVPIIVATIPSFSTYYTISLTYSLTSTLEITTIQTTTLATENTFSNWGRISWSFSFSNRQLTIRLYFSNALQCVFTTTDVVLYERINNVLTLGTLNNNQYYKGFLYSIEVANTVIDFSGRKLAGCGCSACTPSGACLQDCEINEFYSDTGCIECLPECAYGCIRIDNCLLHPDNLCDDFTTLDDTHCLSCVTNAIKLNTCTCIDNSYFVESQRSCICIADYSVYEGQCLNCDRWVQPTEVSAIIRSDFTHIDLYFPFPLGEVGIDCAVIFATESLITFGSGATCTVSINRTVLTLTFGKNFHYIGGAISIKSYSLVGLEVACGYVSFPITVDVQYLSPTPLATAIIDAPSLVVYTCRNLTISGAKSTGSLATTFYYAWSLSSEPQNSLLEKYNINTTSASISVISSDLTDSVITVKLTVSNIYKSHNTATAVVSSTSKQDRLALYYDSTFSNTFKASGDSEVQIYSSQCGGLGQINVVWNVTGTRNNSTSVDIEKIISSQRNDLNLRIPKNLVPANTVITFLASVEDVTYNRTGSIELTLIALIEPPILIVHPMNGTFSFANPLKIDASRSYSLDDDQPVDFSWSCLVDSTSCTPSIINGTSEIMAFKNDSLVVGSTYYFTLIGSISYVNESTVSTRTTIELLIVDYYLPVVSVKAFQPGAVLAMSLPLIFTGSISPNYTDYTYEWTTHDASVSLLTRSNSLSISIDPISLSPGASYTLTFTVQGLTGIGVYSYAFVTNSPPYQGSLVVTPDTGQEYSTVFKLEAIGYIDDEENYPLSYSFGYYNGDNMISLNFNNFSSVFYTTLPYTGEYTVIFVEVLDSMGDSTISQTTAHINLDQYLNITSILENALSQFGWSEFNFDISSNIILQISNAFLNREMTLTGEYTPTSKKEQAILQSAFSLCMEIVNSTLYYVDKLDYQDLQCTITVLKEISMNPNLQSIDNSLMVLDIISFVLQLNTNGMFPAEATNLLDTITNIMPISDSMFLSNTSATATLAGILVNISSQLLLYTGIGEVISISSSEISITVAAITTAQSSNYTLRSAVPETSYVQLPMNFSTLPEVNIYDSIGLSLCTVTPRNTTNQTQVFSILDFTVFSEDYTKIIQVQLTDSDLLINVPILNFSNATPPACVYLDTNSLAWSNYGCSLDTVLIDSLLCKCSHLSIFSASDSFNAALDVLVNSNIATIVNVGLFLSLNIYNSVGLFLVIGILLFYVLVSRYLIKHAKKNINFSLANFSALSKSYMSAESGQGTPNPEHHSGVIRVNVSIDHNHDPQCNHPISEIDTLNVAISERKHMNLIQIPENKTIWRSITEKHELLRLIYKPLREESRFTSFTLVVLKFMLHMFLIGLFYDKTTISSTYQTTSISEALARYTWNDFWIAVYGSAISIMCLRFFIYLLRYSYLIAPHTIEIRDRHTKKQRIKIYIGTVLAILLILFCSWSTILFSIRFSTLTRTLWLINILVGTTLDLSVWGILKTTLIELMKQLGYKLFR